MRAVIISADIVHYFVAALLFLLGGACFGMALAPPTEESADAKLYAAAAFFIAIGLVVGLRP